jgi:hypothetical protein
MVPGPSRRRALAAAPALLLAATALAQMPAKPAARPSDAELTEAAGARIRGATRAAAGADVGGGELALLAAYQPPGAAKIAFALVALEAGPNGLAAAGRDELPTLDGAGTPAVSLSATAAPVGPGALLATIALTGADGVVRERSFVYRLGGGRLTRLHALPEARRLPAGALGVGLTPELEVLPTSSGGFRDLRVRTRRTDCRGGGTCAEQVDVASWVFDGVRYAERPHAIPFLETISASSTLEERGGLSDHSAAAAVDGRLDTSWCEGAKGPGWFEKLELAFSPAQRVKALVVVPGPGTGEPAGERKGPKRIRVLLPDGRKLDADLADEARAQRVALPEGDRIFGMTIVLVDVYKGTKEDACIAELDLEVEP